MSKTSCVESKKARRKGLYRETLIRKVEKVLAKRGAELTGYSWDADGEIVLTVSTEQRRVQGFIEADK